MDDVMNFQASRNDMVAMAMYVYQARQQTTHEMIDITIQGFKFQCSTQSGEVTQLLNRDGSVTSRLGAKEAETYIYQLQSAMALAAKIHLLSELQKIPDTALTSLIKMDLKDTTSLDERVINSLLKRLSQSPGTTLLARAGLFKSPTPRSEALQVVRQELEKVGVRNLNTFLVAESLCATIRARLSLDRPAPKPDHR
jgi:hypothetical protein